MSEEYNPDFYKRRPSRSGLGGMLDHEDYTRTAEQKNIVRPDGTQETVYTITEISRRTSSISAANSKDYKTGTEAYTALRKPIADQNTPLHHLAHMKNSMMEEVEARLAGRLEASPRGSKQYLTRSGE